MTLTTAPQYDRFYRYPEFTAHLHQFVHAFPDLLSIESIGKSHEGRDIWVLTATSRKTGDAADKPAYWVDANIHASELAGSAAAMYFIDTLTKNYGKRDDITRLLDTRTVYICPRMNPDGAEWAMRTMDEGGPKIIRSSTRTYPFEEEAIDGLDIEDVDGDGRILSMRIKDANGNWKCHPAEPRLMIARGPDEYGGTYYRMLPEGTLRDYDGYTVRVNKDKQGLDLNRNFPAGWRQEFEQLGAGPYPTSEPEVRAVVHFITHHSNITGGLTFHTWSGVLLRPFSTLPDDELPAEDLWVYKKQGEKGTEITGYPAISVYHEFRYHPKDVISGTFDWIYEHLGLYEWTIEIWCPMREAGVKDYKYIDWFRDHPVEDDLKMLKWADAELKGKGYIDWYTFKHPQLGEVEIGGWDKIYSFRNPPPHLLEREIAKFPDWLIYNAMTSPKLELVTVKSEKIGDDTHHITMVVQNTGHLPSYVSKRALARGQSRGVIAEISLPKTAELISGRAREPLGELEGRAYKHTLMSFWTDTSPTADRALVEWVVKGKGEVKLVARHEKAGTVRASVSL
jgi:murein tripeptide amidase MpaA